MHLNRIRDIKRIKGEIFKFSRIGADDDDSSDSDEFNDSKLEQNE